MIKKGDKVYHWQKMNRIGIVIEILSESNNQMTMGGTTDVRIFYKIKYPDDSIEIHRSGDIQKSFD